MRTIIVSNGRDKRNPLNLISKRESDAELADQDRRWLWSNSSESSQYPQESSHVLPPMSMMAILMVVRLGHRYSCLRSVPSSDRPMKCTSRFRIKVRIGKDDVVTVSMNERRFSALRVTVEKI